MAEKFTDPWAGGRRGIDILADILSCAEPATVTHIMKGLQSQLPQVVGELRRRLLTFEDLAMADARGVQKLLKRITLRDLALALKGATDGVLQNLGNNMSQRMIQDLRDEITSLGPKPAGEVEAARGRIMNVVRELINARELFIERPGSPASSRTIV